MLRCKVTHLLISLFPFHFWQDFLIRSHIQKCEACMSRVASRDEARALIIQEDDVGNFRDLWPAIKTGVVEKKPEKKAILTLNRRWIFAAASIVGVFLVGILLYSILFQIGSLSEQEGEARFQINSIRVGDEPATPFLYQPKDSDMILVWAEKSL
jgi:hypothetical protein